MITTTRQADLLATADLALDSRAEHDAADPYVHADYRRWEDRQRRLINALADGDDELARAFFEACFDITHDGVAHMVQTFNRIRSDLRGGE